MITNIIVGVTSGVLTGVFVGAITVRHVMSKAVGSPASPKPDPFDHRDLDAAAHRWAASVGRPGFGPYAAKHLRNAVLIQRSRRQRSAARKRSWWA